ncbi:MAG: hypothetical protein IPJ26_15900 [Bacteroidetes bacterium]|nr:hypothetical protein [Bacteroidota bacterium]
MTSNQAKYNYKLIFASAVLVVVASAAFYFYWDTTKLIIRKILEAPFTVFILWVVTVLIFLFHYYQHKNKEVASEPIITKNLGHLLTAF